MKITLAKQIIKGYENQLLNAEVNKDLAKIKWLKEQINEGNKYIAQFGTYNN